MKKGKKIFVTTLVCAMIAMGAMSAVSVSALKQRPDGIKPVQPKLKLDIDAPSYVRESWWFPIIVTAQGQPVPNATVIFNNTVKYTNSSGGVWFRAPWVNQSTNKSIVASKDGYLPDMEWILILDYY